MQHLTHVVFSSAGFKGVAFAGVIDAIEDHMGTAHFEEWRGGIRGVAGTSSGAIASLALTLGLQRAVRQTLLHKFSNVNEIMRRPDVAHLLARYGLEDGMALREHLSEMLTLGGLSYTSTLGDLKRLLRINFVCVATNLNTGAAYHMSGKDTPEIRVVDAVYASCCVPFAFVPFRLKEGVTLVDGCLTESLPCVFPEAETLHVKCTEVAIHDEISSWPVFVSSIISCSHAAQDKQGDKANTVRLEGGALETVPVFGAELDEDSPDMLRARGYAIMYNWLLKDRFDEVLKDLVVAVTVIAQFESAPAEAAET